MAIPNGIGTVVCVKPVPVGARDFVMCTETAAEGRSYKRVKGASLNCPDPSAPPSGSKADTDNKDDDDDDDDAKADEMMQKMLKQGQEFLQKQAEVAPIRGAPAGCATRTKKPRGSGAFHN